MKFPYISLLFTGKHTEIVLTRGVGLHTILGMTIDSAVGECFDKAYVVFKKYDKVLHDEDN
jgi:N6-L-threonylcarbamoyladenine synthase